MSGRTGKIRKREMGKMRINVSNMPVKEFEMLVCMLQLCGWWIEISASEEAVWIRMDKPVVDSTPVGPIVCSLV